MESARTNKSLTKQFLIIFLIAFFACFALLLIDSETKGIVELLEPGNIFSFLIYFIPAFSFSLVIYKLSLRKYITSKSLLLALLIGIPLSFILVISIFLLMLP